MIDTWKIELGDSVQFGESTMAEIAECDRVGCPVFCIGNPQDGSVIALLTIEGNFVNVISDNPAE